MVATTVVIPADAVKPAVAVILAAAVVILMAVAVAQKAASSEGPSLAVLGSGRPHRWLHSRSHSRSAVTSRGPCHSSELVQQLPPYLLVNQDNLLVSELGKPYS
ncbi:hypothetical protein JRQ81_015636 [Phrynocephalus forsythii]|uniref:Uncharacterized protein n=1 Tax=Phrynocephalus forsythii TaxID=171643 RepID=A0A9Q1B2G7_9SAUR|nr:hypothetical protein JRQ81_015636 [Phrynocephalus forsythii]